ncbi:MAG TPA: cytochrome c [Candidatus Dormibacteraeota bacterium]|nr:cytochrome c [Candidatus Dormibacteraeota bacterium]
MSQRRHLLAAVLGVAIASPGLHGCVRGCTSSQPPILINTSMFNQPKALPYASSDFFFDGMVMRVPVPGTVARGDLPPQTAAGAGGPGEAVAEGAAGAGSPSTPEAREAQLARGRERFGIYCAPCHDERGEGRGILFERAKVPTANLHDQKIREQSDDNLFETISNGKGLMPAYRYPIMPADRRAIIAYVRQLQAADAPVEASR